MEVKPQDNLAVNARSRPTGALMNQNRRIIFQHLCKRPCLELGQIAKAVGLSRSSVKWHMDVLIDAGYIQTCELKKITYCPNGLVTRKNMPIFSMMANINYLTIFDEVIHNPGTSPEMIRHASKIPSTQVRKCLGDMVNAGLISQMRDGKYSRYFPTEMFNVIIREEKNTQREFVRFLVNKMSGEHLKPEIVELKGTNSVISINILGQVDKIIIPHMIDIDLKIV